MGRFDTGHQPTCRSWRCGWEWKTENGAGVCRLPQDSDIHYVGTVDSHAFVRQVCDCVQRADTVNISAIAEARRFASLPTVDADSKRVILALLSALATNAECRCDCVNCVTGHHIGCYYRPSTCPEQDREAFRAQALYSVQVLADMERQRDELLASLKDLLGVFEIRDFVRPEVARARQVMAEAERK